LELKETQINRGADQMKMFLRMKNEIVNECSRSKFGLACSEEKEDKIELRVVGLENGALVDMNKM
jgi:hypothetical protein